MTNAQINYGVDLITFLDPSYWGCTDEGDLVKFSRRAPEVFWSKLSGVLAELPVRFLELTFAPADPGTVLAAFGSAEGFRDHLRALDLQVKSGYWFGPALEPGADHAAVAHAATAYARFIVDSGGDTVVAGLPMLSDTGGRGCADPSYSAAVAPLLDHVGAAVAAEGARFAVHTESSSTFWSLADVNALFEQTDPALVGFCPDSAHLVLAGSDPVRAVARHRDRTLLAHWKDAVGPLLPVALGDDVFEVHRRQMRPLGDGQVHWQRWAAALAGTPAEPWRLLELDMTSDPVTAVIDGVAFAESLTPAPVQTPHSEI